MLQETALKYITKTGHMLPLTVNGSFKGSAWRAIRRQQGSVRSALLKQRTGGLVVRWVTTSEYPLLYVLTYLCSHLVLVVNS
jgi:hypothetical protein